MPMTELLVCGGTQSEEEDAPHDRQLAEDYDGLDAASQNASFSLSRVDANIFGLRQDRAKAGHFGYKSQRADGSCCVGRGTL